MLANSPPRVIEQLEAADERQTLDANLAGQSCLNAGRLAWSLCSDLEPIGLDAITSRVAVIFEELHKGRNYSSKVVSLIAERIFEASLLRAVKPESMELAYIMGERILQLLTEDNQAIRRLR